MIFQNIEAIENRIVRDPGMSGTGRPPRALRALGILAVLAAAPVLFAGLKDAPPRSATPAVEVRPAAGPIRVDGVLDEAAWESAARLDIIYEWMPGENTPAPVKSTCLITYDRSKLYVAFRCEDPDPSRIRAHLMDRDAIDTFIQDDHVSFMLDTFNDERRAFQFRVNPLGVQADAAYSEIDGFEDFSWDAIWASAGTITATGYAIEVAIPFNQLRFPRGGAAMTWGFEAERSYPRSVRHRLSSHRRDRDINCNICQFNSIAGFEGISPGRNVQLTPTLTADRTDRREDLPSGPLGKGRIRVEPGITARWGVTPNLMLNATANPDFSQVEADAAQLDVNTRFALYYPEKRPFFLEGADFFLTPVQAVFTRTVADPLWGGKLTGKSGRSAVGFFASRDRINNLLFPSNQGSADTSLDDEVTGGVFRYRHDVGRGSTLGALYAGRVGDGYHNHVAGVDGFLRLGSKDSLWFQGLRSQSKYPGTAALDFGQKRGDFGGNALAAGYQHMTRDWALFASYQDLDPGFRADSGFVPRVDYRTVDLEVDGFLYGLGGGGKRGTWFDSLSFWVRAYRTEDHSGRMTDSRLALGGIYRGPLQSQVGAIVRWNREFFDGRTYDVSDLYVDAWLNPAGGARFGVTANFAGAIDYANSRPARALRFGPATELGIGRHLNLNLSHSFERLTHDGARIYTANLFQARVIYNIDTRCFLRAIVQYRDVGRDPAMYALSVDPRSRRVFAQFLFSYKLNAQTVLFVGYSDNSAGVSSASLVRTDRTFFLKIGYAWMM